MSQLTKVVNMIFEGTTVRRYGCPVCTRTFVRKGDLYSHLQQTACYGRYQEKEWEAAVSLLTLQKRVKDERKMRAEQLLNMAAVDKVCPICGKEGKTKTTTRRHLRMCPDFRVAEILSNFSTPLQDCKAYTTIEMNVNN